ncbi:MAG: hypothetical protein M3N47_08345 [Chloroflexota bacterium]|nr:hypothetical protein [Chloroflexota bacterium]
MTGDRPSNVFETLLSPLRLPGRVLSDTETLAQTVLSLLRNTERHLDSLNDKAGALVARVGELHGQVEGIDDRVEKLESLEATIKGLIGGLRTDLNDRMLAVDGEVRPMHSLLRQMASDVAKIDDLLPDASDGPLQRLKDTLTSSGS